MSTTYLCAGFLGAVLMYVGDMMLYATTKPLPPSFHDDVAMVRFFLQESSPRRIFIGGVLGPFAATLYILGFLHIPAMALDQVKMLGWGLFCLFAVAFVFGGAYHMAWIFLGDAVHLNDEKYLTTIQVRFSQLKPIVFGLLFLSTFFLSMLILLGGLNIPSWYVLITPMILLLFLKMVRKIPQPYGIWLWGGWINLVFVIYYAVLLLTIN